MENSAEYNVGYEPEIVRNGALETAVIDALQKRALGREHAIERPALVEYLVEIGALAGGNARTDDRKLRSAINSLRKQGWPICSTGGVKSPGYWLAYDLAELDEYINRELIPRISDMRDQVAAMRKGAGRMWGHGAQMGLF